jgi:nucleotide-binding universal stress UspA family protein
MAKRILVPLDQSRDAECLVPFVADAARGAQAVVRLLHVASVPEGWTDEYGRVVVYADQEMQRLEAEGLDYLLAIAVQFGGAPVEFTVRFGDPVTEILREAETFDADLIAVSTAGRSGVGRVILGSVAEQVFRKSTVPVVLMRPPAEAA